MGPAKQHILGFITADIRLSLDGKNLSYFEPWRYHLKANTTWALTRLRLVSTPKPGVNEKPYQCENRIGIFESLWVSTSPIDLPTVEHPLCFHKGDNACCYIISWEKNSFYHLEADKKLFSITDQHNYF